MVSADAADELAKIIQTVGLGLAVMSGANLVTVVKFIQFMGPPEAPGRALEALETAVTASLTEAASLAHVQSDGKLAVNWANPSILHNFFEVNIQGLAD